jgi:O-antigen chain-terminating methyltransferase
MQQALELVGNTQHLSLQAGNRVQQTELRALQHEQRAAAAEALALEHEQRAAAAEALALEHEQRAATAEALALEHEQRAAAAEALARDRQLRVDELANGCHHWWQHATALEAQRTALLHSRSWRITAPLRVTARLVLHARHTLQTAVNHTVHGAINTLQRPLSHIMRAVLRRPQLAYRSKHWLMRHPSLHQLLLDVARRQGVVPGAPGHVPLAPAVPPTLHAPDLQLLTPRARQIYADLKTAIENNKRTD